MLIFAIDDEPKMLRFLHNAIAEAEPKAEIQDFLLGAEAVSRVTEQGVRPDVVFADIQMPGMTGMDLALRLKQLAPETKIIFVTGYDEYALDAFKLHVNGYVMKPVDARAVREELDALGLPLRPAEPDKLRVRCFGYFDVFWHDEPLIFTRTQTRELFAYLVDREGAACTEGEIITALWEDNENIREPKAYLRVLTQDLKATLTSVGMEDVLIRVHRQWAVRTEKLDCDYYRLKKGDPAALNAYNGEYMKQYSWAEMTLAMLQFGKI